MKILKTLKNLAFSLMFSGICLFGAQSLWAIGFISAQEAHNNAAAGIGVVIDVRTVEEHNGCDRTSDDPGIYVLCPTDEIANRGAPAWVDTASGIQMQAVNIPFWYNTGASGTTPQSTADFGNSFQALVDSGYITYTTPLYLLCRSGYRSYYGGVWLETNFPAFTNVYNLDNAGGVGGSGTGGMLEWYATGLPIPWNTDYSAIDRGYKPPQILSITPAAGDTVETSTTVTFTVGILEPRWGDDSGVLYYTIIERLSLYIDGTETEFTLTDPTVDLQWTEYTFTTSLANGSYNWDVRAESENRSDLGNDASNLIGWTPNADASGPGLRTVTVSNVPDISLDVSTLSFGNVISDTTSSALIVTVTNNGEIADLDVTSLSITGGEFTVDTENCVTPLIPALGSCAVNVVFAPTSAGGQIGTLSISSDDLDTATATVDLSGTGTEAEILVSPTTLDFGAVTTGYSSTLPITVTSNGTADLDIGTITISGTDYTIPSADDNCSDVTGMTNGSTCTFNVVFAPTSEATLTGTVTIPSNDPAGDATVSLTGVGIPPEADILVSSTLDFGTVTIGTPSTEIITVTAGGTLALDIGSIAITGTVFTIPIDGCSNQTIAIGADCTVSVEFDPTDENSQLETITIPSNDPAGDATVSLTGTGSLTPVAGLVMSPTSLDFGNVTTGTSSTLPITLTSDGTANLDIGSITITGTGYTIPSADDNCSDVTGLANGATCTFNVVFSPATEATPTGTVTIPSNDPDGDATVSLTGTGTAANILVTTPDDFGNVAVGDTSGAKQIIVTSDGTEALDIGTITITGDFGISNNNCTDVTGIANGSTCTFDVTFSPTAEGDLTGTVTIPSNDPDGDATVSLTGTGSPTPVVAISVSPASLDFGAVTTGTSSALSIMVTSNGLLNLDIGSITITGTGYTIPSADDNCSDVTGLAITETCTFDVVFSPESDGDLTGTVTIPSNDSDGDVTVSLSGTGTTATALVANIAVSASSLDFGSVTVGSPASQTITVTSDGTDNLDIGTIAITGEFELQNNSCSDQTIAIDSTCTFDVVFKPTSDGDKTGSVTIPSNDPDGDMTVSLQGTGTTGTDDSTTVPVAGGAGPELVSPVDGSTVSSSVTFEWKPFTDAVSYEVYYCKNQDFSGTDAGCSGAANTIEVTSVERNGVYFYAGSGLAFILFGLMVLGGVRQRGKLMLFVIAMMISSTMFLVSCNRTDDGGGDDPVVPGPGVSINKTYLVSGLEAGQTYYWGVVAVDAAGAKTASTVWRFTVEAADSGGY